MEDFSKAEPQQQNGITLTSQSLNYLNTTQKWALFFAILGFVAIGLMLLGGLIAASSLGMASISYRLPFSGFSMFLFYLLIAVVYFFPIYFLYQFSRNVKKGIEMLSAEYVEKAMRYQKMMYKYMGIVTIVVLCIYPFVIVGLVYRGL